MDFGKLAESKTISMPESPQVVLDIALMFALYARVFWTSSRTRFYTSPTSLPRAYSGFKSEPRNGNPASVHQRCVKVKPPEVRNRLTASPV